jgi:hypothetical protein
MFLLRKGCAVPLLLMLLYFLGICAAVLVPLYAAHLVINDLSLPVAPNAGAGKDQAAAGPVSQGSNRPPVRMAPTRDYKTAPPAPAESAMAKETPERKKAKAPQKRSVKQRNTEPGMAELGYAPEPRPGFPRPKRD